MTYSEDHIALAAEYALGTLDAGERTQVETMMSVDREFAAMVDAWERKLGVLNQMVGLVEPRVEVWDRIKIAAGLSGSQAPIVLPDAPQPTIETAPAAAVVDPAPQGAAVGATVIDFPAQARRWRNIATTVSAIAAVLVAFIAVQAYRPDTLPASLRPKPQVQIVQAQTPATPAPVQGQYVALLQKDSTSPAFILTVDGATKNFTVRKVGAESETGKSYELWLVSDRLQQPRSLGLIGGKDFTTSPSLTSYDPDMVSKATYAVTVEPEGGAPNGVPTGPIVYTGKLIEAVPPASR